MVRKMRFQLENLTTHYDGFSPVVVVVVGWAPLPPIKKSLVVVVVVVVVVAATVYCLTSCKMRA